ncbi:MAG: 4Fe-4S binding protein [Candidatus Bathyarchaeia archaeon]|jgi:pyruvate ferredoxin oxidoreductase delta subunit
MVSPELEELTWLAIHGRGVINTAHSSQIALTLSQAGVAAGREAFYYMRYDDSPERVQLPFIYYAVFGNPRIRVILPEEVEPVGSVFDTVAVLDSSLLVKSTSQRALLMDGAKKKASLVVNTSLKPSVILNLVRKYGCAQDWEGKIITLRAKKYGQNIALGMTGAIAKAMEPLYSIDDVVESLESEGKTDSVDAVRSAYEEADSLDVTLKAQDCEQYKLKSSLGEAKPFKGAKGWWDREAYMSLKERAANAPTYEQRIEAMPSWEQIAPALIEFGPKVSERNIGFKTSFARTFRPVIDYGKCVNCKLCHVFCPDGAIDYEPIKVNYEYCKGCGICARVCGSKAISMPHELQALEGLDEEEFLTIREALIEYAY